MGFSLFRRVLEKGVFKSGDRRMMCSLSDTLSSISDMRRSLCKEFETFLMVSPLFDDGGDVLNNFRRISWPETITGGGEVVGMSKGWLALYNRDSHGACFLNPITGRRVDLPPLPDPHRPNRMVLDRSPDVSDDSRAVMICGEGKMLAFCVPGKSTEWAPCIDDGSYGGKKFGDEETEYEDVIHSRYENIFYSVTKNPTAVEAWDVRKGGPSIVMRHVSRSDRLNVDPYWRSYWLDLDRNDFPWPYRSEQDWEVKKKKLSWRIKYVLQGPYVGLIYVVVRHVIPHRRPHYGYKTVDFDVYSIGVGTEPRYMKANLNDMSIFIGNNESSGRRIASLHPELKPDCIYFTDDNRLMRRSSFGGGLDNGVFDYRNNAFSTFCSLDDCRNNGIDHHHAPLWFHHF